MCTRRRIRTRYSLRMRKPSVYSTHSLSRICMAIRTASESRSYRAKGFSLEEIIIRYCRFADETCVDSRGAQELNRWSSCPSETPAGTSASGSCFTRFWRGSLLTCRVPAALKVVSRGGAGKATTLVHYVASPEGRARKDIIAARQLTQITVRRSSGWRAIGGNTPAIEAKLHCPDSHSFGRHREPTRTPRCKLQ